MIDEIDAETFDVATLEETPTGMIFPNHKLDTESDIIKLQEQAVEFVTSVILRHEKCFYDLIEKTNKLLLKSILGTNNQSILSMIITSTDLFYNSLYMDIQNKIVTPLTTIINQMTTLAEYGPHVLLDKLYKLTINCHSEISRDELIVKSGPEKYMERILTQINTYLVTKNTTSIFSKSDGEDIPFVVITDDAVPFQTTIQTSD